MLVNSLVLPVRRSVPTAAPALTLAVRGRLFVRIALLARLLQRPGRQLATDVEEILTRTLPANLIVNSALADIIPRMPLRNLRALFVLLATPLHQLFMAFLLMRVGQIKHEDCAVAFLV